MSDLFGNKEMRYLGWKQPYAELMFYGKQETRTWPTTYRSLVLITASQQSYTDGQVLSISGEKQFRRIRQTTNMNQNANNRLRGYAIGVGRLVDCQPMRKEDEDICFVEYREPWEVTRKNGWKKIQRLWRHIYADVIKIEPIKIKGAQGWRKLSPEFIKTIKIIG